MNKYDQRIEQVIAKYDLDKLYPEYQCFLRAKELIPMFEYQVLREQKVLLISNEENDLWYFKRNTNKTDCYTYKRIRSKEQVKNVHECQKQYDVIVLISNDVQMKQTLQKENIEFICLYDWLSENGLECKHPFYWITDENHYECSKKSFGNRMAWFFSPALCMVYLWDDYREVEEQEEKQSLLKKLIFWSLYTKDFLSFTRYMETYAAEAFADADRMALLRHEVEETLLEMENLLKARQKKDIIWFWLDALNYDDVPTMPYLYKKNQEGIQFTNAYTVVANTNPTLKTILCDAKTLEQGLQDVNKIGYENSPLLRRMQEEGYDFRIVSGYLKQPEEQFMVKANLDMGSPASMIFWNTLCELIENPKPVVILAHALAESHGPYYSVLLEGSNVGNYSVRRRLGRKALDMQLQYYSPRIHNAIKMYFSDHGQPGWSTSFHTTLSISGDGIPKKKMDKMFSYLDFERLMYSLFKEDYEFTNLPERKFVKVQGLDMYNRERCLEVLRQEEPLNLGLFGYQGVITEDEVYLQYTMGQEFWSLTEYAKRKPAPYIDASHGLDGLSEERRNYLRERLGDVQEIRRLTPGDYSEYIHAMLKQHYAESEETKRKREVINQMFEEIPDKERIAIRMGGLHSSMLMEYLTEENRRRIVAFIDPNGQCLCRYYNNPIYSLEELKEYEVSTIILSSFDHREMLRKEAETYSDTYRVIEMYDYLEKNGIDTTACFYQMGKVKGWRMPKELS